MKYMFAQCRIWPVFGLFTQTRNTLCGAGAGKHGTDMEIRFRSDTEALFFTQTQM